MIIYCKRTDEPITGPAQDFGYNDYRWKQEHGCDVFVLNGYEIEKFSEDLGGEGITVKDLVPLIGLIELYVYTCLNKGVTLSKNGWSVGPEEKND